MMAQHIPEPVQESVTETVEQIAKFAPGDRVTMSPTDHDAAYYGSEFEGVLLTVERVFWRGNDVKPIGEDAIERDPERFDSERMVECPDEEYDLYIHNVTYEFREHTRTLNESGLMAWGDYREEYDRVRLYSDDDHETVYLEPRDEPCPDCGCNLLQRMVYDNGVISAGRETCPACNRVESERAP